MKNNGHRGNSPVRIIVYLLLLILCLIAAGLFCYLYMGERLSLPFFQKEIELGEPGKGADMTEEQPKPAVLHHASAGWNIRSGKRCYYEKGKRVTGWHTIDGECYYFDKAGFLVTNQSVDKNLFVDKQGILIPKEELYGRGKRGLSDLEETLLPKLEGYAGTWSIYVKNLDTNEYVSINNQEIKPASLIKLYNMVYAFDRMEQGELEESEKLDSLLNSMITVSNNDAYNQLLTIHGNGNLLQGTRLLNEFCQKQGYTMTVASGTLRPSKFKDQWLCQSSTSVEDCGHVLEDIYRECLVSQKASRSMLKLLKGQQKNDKISRALPEGTVCAHKTGEAQKAEHDAAIVCSDGADYVLVIMSMEDKVAIPHIWEVSRVVYEYFNGEGTSPIKIYQK